MTKTQLESKNFLKTAQIGNSLMTRYLITVEYDGTAYAGWQRQVGQLSIQEVLERAWATFFEEKITLRSAGRTDAGVHALAMPAHFDSQKVLTGEKIVNIFNSALPRDIAVKSAKTVGQDFHARYSAVKKTYRYTIFNSPIKPALNANRVGHIKKPLDIDAIKAAAKHIVGTHDFKAFCASGSSVVDFYRTIEDLKIMKAGEYITLEITGNGFLYNMVRIIAGTLVYVGLGKIAPNDIPDIIKSGERKRAGKTLAASGLLLVGVTYCE